MFVSARMQEVYGTVTLYSTVLWCAGVIWLAW